jgi:hypothetical protein
MVNDRGPGPKGPIASGRAESHCTVMILMLAAAAGASSPEDATHVRKLGIVRL